MAAEGIVGVDLLITRFRFGTPQPVGPSLARLARTRHRDLKVLFVARPEFQDAAVGSGEFVPAPARIEDVMLAVARLVTPQE